MSTKNSHIKKLLIASAIVLTCIVVGRFIWSATAVLHENTANKHWQNKRYLSRKNNLQNISGVDSCVRLLQTGDLLVRRGDDMTSYILSQLNMKDKTYSHCGIVVIENGYPYVYHSIGGEDNPDEILRRDSAHTWCSPANNHAFAAYRYNMADSMKARLASVVQGYYSEGRMFDMAFDISTDDRLYCSEMIYKALKKATGVDDYIQLSNNYGRSFVGVDDLYLMNHTEPVCRIRFK
jgi:hypothetical protein